MYQRLSRIATTYGAAIYDLNRDSEVRFGQDQYLDSVHLSSSGARRFVRVTDAVVGSAGFKSLCGQSSMINKFSKPFALLFS